MARIGGFKSTESARVIYNRIRRKLETTPEFQKTLEETPTEINDIGDTGNGQSAVGAKKRKAAPSKITKTSSPNPKSSSTRKAQAAAELRDLSFGESAGETNPQYGRTDCFL